MTTGITPAAANDAAAAYQRLRGHLAYLKPGAAAEALPGILDAARDGDLTALQAIEQLMDTEAAAAAQRKLASRLRWAALPAPWTIDDYDFSAQPGADHKLIRELATLRFIDDIGNHRYQKPPDTQPASWREQGTRTLAGGSGSLWPARSSRSGSPAEGPAARRAAPVQRADHASSGSAGKPAQVSRHAPPGT
jgi:hypothetical protein